MRGLAVLLATTACAGDPSARVVIEGAPVVLVGEGGAVSLGVSIDRAPDQGACAAPFDPAGFTVETASPDRFDRLALIEQQGQLMLELELRCDAVQEGEGDLLVDVEVSAIAGCARAGVVRLQVADRLAPYCSPRVEAWTGDCATVPDAAGREVAVDSTDAPPPVCVRVASRDPAHESLSVRSTSSLPGRLVAGALPDASGFDDRTFEVALADLTHVVGEFTIDLELTRGSFDDGSPVIDDGVSLVVGEPGIAIDVAADVPLVATETEVAAVPVRVFRYDSDDANSTCLRLERPVPPGSLPRAKPFARVENATTGEGSSDGEADDLTGWVCGSQFLVHLSPPIDAAASESLVFEASTCTACDGDPMPAQTPVTRSVEMAAESIADQLRCGIANGSPDLDTACADLGDDDTPELVFLNRGSSNKVCAWRGDTGRHLPVAFDAASQDVPLAITQLMWRDPAAGATPVVLGRFAAAPTVRRLAIGTEASWVAATDLGIAAVPAAVARTKPLAADPGSGATHLAVPNGRSIVLRCIAPADPVITDCQTVTVSDLAAAGSAFADVAVADLDGDGDQDVIGFAVPTAEPYTLTIHSVELDWTDAGVPAVVGTGSLVTPLEGDRFANATVNRFDCTGASCREQVLVVPTLGGEARVRLLSVLAVGTDATALDTAVNLTPSLAVGVVARNNRAVVAMSASIMEVEVDAGAVRWAPRDPVTIEDSLVGIVNSPLFGYGRGINPCLSNPGGISFAAGPNQMRWTRLNVDVGLP